MSSFDICSICLGEMTRDDRILLLCKHWFHESCINRWWYKSKSLHCPYCRKSCLTGLDDDENDFYKCIDRLIIKCLMNHASADFGEIIEWIKNRNEFKIKYID